ncbi:MAG: hypothetical protein WCC92_10385 [Candidatus Korobacteraceae bacterium]
MLRNFNSLASGCPYFKLDLAIYLFLTRRFSVIVYFHSDIEISSATNIMTFTKRYILVATLAFAVMASGQLVGQVAPSGPQTQTSPAPSAAIAPQNLPPQNPAPLFDFKDSDIKFSLNSLMNVLRDSRHEGWVLAVYPDPKTSRPLIGAGFGLDVPETEHPQRDPFNPHPFIEPSTAQLWQAAGLDSAKLQNILDQFDREMNAWKKKNFRRKIKTQALSPQLTEEEATQLLRISAIQATYNARAYCREFDQLTASQQMALSQLVYQMGVNLDEFTQFLSVINDDAASHGSVQPVRTAEPEVDHWKTVQSALIQSQWARHYRIRAIAVIAMFDPNYDDDPVAAERKVEAVLRPPRVHHRKKAHVRSVRAGNDTNHNGKMLSSGTPGSRTGKS